MLDGLFFDWIHHPSVDLQLPNHNNYNHNHIPCLCFVLLELFSYDNRVSDV